MPRVKRTELVTAAPARENRPARGTPPAIVGGGRTGVRSARRDHDVQAVRRMTQLASAGGDTAADNLGGDGGESIAPRPYVLSATARGPLDADELETLDAWWRAANYLSVGQIYLMANPLVREPLAPEHVKPRLLGHFGTVPGLNLVWVHANRMIRAHDLNAGFVAGPGHGGPGPNACAWLEGAYSELYSHIPRDATGMGALFAQFSAPGG